MQAFTKLKRITQEIIQAPSKIKRGAFHQHLCHCIDELVKRFYHQSSDYSRFLSEFKNCLMELPSTENGAFVLVDMDPSQFLSNGEIITGLVDTEAYVIAPRELDFIALEYFLDEQSAKNFKRGYEKVRQLPTLQPADFLTGFFIVYCPFRAAFPWRNGCI